MRYSLKPFLHLNSPRPGKNLGFILILLTSWFLPQATHANSFKTERFIADDMIRPPHDLDITSLNIRLSTRPLHPPPDMIQRSIRLPPMDIARSMVGQSPQGAILEDDHRRRVAILTRDDDGHLITYLLESKIPDPSIPFLLRCAEARQCASDRRPVTGGLGCIAICLKESFDSRHTP